MRLPQEFHSIRAEVNGWVMHHVASIVPVAPATPVVLVHGVGLSHRYLMPYARLLAHHYRVFVPDMPGFGLSHKPDEILRLDALAEWVIRWMNSVGLQRVIMLGNSVGCQVIVNAAVRHPDRILCAVLQGPTVDPDATTFGQQMWRWYQNRNVERSREKGPMVVRDYWECGVKRLVRTFRYAIEDHIEKKLPRVMCPTLIVRGGLDPIVPQAWAERATEMLPRGRLIILPGVPHTANLEAPLELLRVTLPFFNSQTQRHPERADAHRPAAHRPAARASVATA